MEGLLLLVGVGLLVGPIVIALVSLSKSASAKHQVGDLDRRIFALYDRLARVEEVLDRLQSAGAPERSTEAAAMSEELLEEVVLAPVDVSAYEAPIPKIEEAAGISAQQPVAEETPATELQQEAELTQAAEEVSEPITEETKPAVQAAPLPPHIERPALAETTVVRFRSLEEKVAANWLVWVGGLAVALAGVFLVRYAAEQGWLSPELRCVAGVLFGAALVVAGETIRRRPMERAIAAIRPDYVPQALTAAGLFTAFASIYLAHAFYQLLPPTLTFLLLGAIALLGFGLSLLEGQFVAALGLVGAMGTPALVSTDNPTAWGFYSYLGIIAVAAMAVSDRRRWWWLSLAAIVTSFLWTVVWFAKQFATLDIPPMATVSGVTAGVALLLASRAFAQYEGPPVRDRLGFTADAVAWTALAVALATVLGLALRSEFAPAAHWAVLATATAAVAISRWQPRFDLVVPATCILVIAAFGLTYVDGIAIDNLAERAFGWPETTLYARERYSAYVLHASLISAAVFAGGLFIVRSSIRPSYVALSTAAVPLILLAAGYAEFRNITGDEVWALPAAVVLVASVAVTGMLNRTEVASTFVAGVYATAAVAAAVLALTFLFDRAWLTVAYAALLIVMGAISVGVDLGIIRRLAGLVAMLVVLRLTVNPDLRGYELFQPLGMQWVIYGYLVPAAAFIAAARLFRRTHDDVVVTVLEGGALLFAVMFVSIEIRVYMTGTIYSGAYELPEMSLQTISWLTTALILCLRHARHPRLFSLWGARLLTLAGTGQTVALQLVIYNPVFTGEVIQGHGLFNILILALAAPGVLLWLIAANFAAVAPQGLAGPPGILTGLRAASTLLVFAFVTEEVRVFFQGMLITPKQASLLELYVTTLFWLVPALLPYASHRVGTVAGARGAALGVILASVVMIVAGHLCVFNPAFTGEVVRGWPVVNVLLLGVFVPAVILWWLSFRVEARFRPYVFYVCYFILFVGVWLMVKQGFEGGHLTMMHTSLLELYSTTLVWLGMAALPLVSRRIGGYEGARGAATAVLAISLLMLFAGHSVAYNPVIDGGFVRGWPVFNTLLLGFVVPAFIVAAIAQTMKPVLRPWLGGLAYVLLFTGVTLIVKQAFQGGYLVWDILSERESYAYSAAWIGLAIVTMIAGLVWVREELRYAALAVLVIAVLKVFLLDMSGLGGLWRVASFLGLGLSLIGIGWVHQRFIYNRNLKPGTQTDTSDQTVAS